MKKYQKFILIILLGTIIFSILFLGIKYSSIKENKKITTDLDQKLFQCLENELNYHIASDKKDLIDIPLNEIIKDINTKFEFYKGVYNRKNTSNIYVIAYPEKGIFDAKIMKNFDKYFNEKFSIYQMTEYLFGPKIYIHSANNDIDLEKIYNKCSINNISDNDKSIALKTKTKLKNTKKIIIKSNKELGIIKDKDKISKILNAISSSKKQGDSFLCDGHTFDFEMYDDNNKLIDTIYVWGDGKRLIPASLSGGCTYYTISYNIDLREIIETETDYVFYNILDLRDNDNQKLQLIYKDKNNNYYIKSDNYKEILINFTLNNQVMTLKYALENKYISAEKIFNEYPNILIKE